MNEITMRRVRYMIEKECERISLSELCEDRLVTVDDFFAYLNAADKALRDEQETHGEKNE